ncbi:MAG: hypothetical protein A2161_21975 [Candidatus Schekmanbacteria bacterium RBG_13_48_7]|uniref:Uncharacterized protein n=1 Tax=Candidatus Schekmanbacteria bacterium RBG_13_48_7 TaxID=1817878 RepID=A0A1F7RZ29_9BACT|nr:MAG: hypothetical protein A2161_21975 [Candidatus Schekmanbacteria bacterium RBG_13_48_7]
MWRQKNSINCVVIVIFFMMAIHVSAGEVVKPQIDLNGQYKAISWIYSTRGEQIDKEKDLDLTLVFRKNKFFLNTLMYEVDNTVHILAGTSSDKYKAFWTDGGYKLVIEIYVAEDGTYKLDGGGNPVKSVSSFYFSKDEKQLFWETLFPNGMLVTRKYEKVVSSKDL